MDEDALDLKKPQTQSPPNLISLSSISLESSEQLPRLFDITVKMKWFLDLQFIRFKTPKLKKHFTQAVLSSRNISYIESLLWYLLLIKLPIIAFKNKTNRQWLTQQLKEELHQRLSRNYVELFMNISSPKEKVTNLLMFTNTFFILKMYSETFKAEQVDILITPRFVFDCFHIVVFEALGMEVSDRYIEKNLSELFVDFFHNINAEHAKKSKSKEAALQKQKKIKADRQTDFFEGKTKQAIPANMDQAQFLKELEQLMYVDVKFDKKQSHLVGQKRSLLRRESRTSLSTNTKSSFNIGGNQLKRAQAAVMKRQQQEQRKKIEQQRRKMQFIGQMENMQATKSSQAPQRQTNSKQTLSLVRLGPCVSSFLNLGLNKVPGSRVKYINHPQEKVITNDYLRRLLAQVTQFNEAPIEQKPSTLYECDISKPMKGMTLMEISSYRMIYDRQRQRQIEPGQSSTSISPQKPTINPEQRQRSEIKLPKIAAARSLRFRRPEVIKEQDESKLQDVFFNPKGYLEADIVPEEFKQVKYKNNLSKYRLNYMPKN